MGYFNLRIHIVHQFWKILSHLKILPLHQSLYFILLELY